MLTPELVNHVPVPGDGVLITVEVPRETRVWVNGHETGSTGETRLFTANGMEPMKKYDFKVRMRSYIDGKWVDKTKTVALEAGERESLSLAKVIEEDNAKQAEAKPAAAPAADAKPDAKPAAEAKSTAAAADFRPQANLLVGE